MEGPLKTLSILILPAMLLGCSATAPEQQAQIAGTTCWKEIPTGSNLAVTKCTTEEERQRQKQQVDVISDEILRSAPSKTRGSSGM